MESAKKLAVRSYIDAVGRGDGATISGLVTDDYAHEFVGTTELAGKRRTLSEILEMLEGFSSAMVSPATFTFQKIVEEGDWVLASFTGNCALKNGKRFDGEYYISVQFDGDKILYLRELMDTKLAEYALS